VSVTSAGSITLSHLPQIGGLKKNNPHKHLEKAEYYKKILDDWNKDEM
jgi:hypothetical protein